MSEISQKTNTRHKMFKNELRAYHDTINRRNRYNLPKISGKLNMFESEDDDNSSEEIENSDKISIDRKIPNTALSVLERGNLQAIGTADGKPLTDFKYKFIEGAMGNEKKIISCVTDDGKIEYFDVDSEIVLECAGASTIGISTLNTSGGKVNNAGDYHEIEYGKVKKDLMIPYLSGYRIKDMRNGKLLSKGVKRRKRN